MTNQQILDDAPERTLNIELRDRCIGNSTYELIKKQLGDL